MVKLVSVSVIVFPLASCWPALLLVYEGDYGSALTPWLNSRSDSMPGLFGDGTRVKTSSSAVFLVESLRTLSSLAESNVLSTPFFP